jgi:hypothetical protein
MRTLLLASSVLLLALASACAHYQTPGGGISIPSITDADIPDVMARQPAAQFPAHLIVARVQASGYVSRLGYGDRTGQFSVLTTAISRPTPISQDSRRCRASRRAPCS